MKSIEETYLLPSLDDRCHSVQEDGRFWDFDWYSEGNYKVQACSPRFSVEPVWEPPHRRRRAVLVRQSTVMSASIKDTTHELDWIPDYKQVSTLFYFASS